MKRAIRLLRDILTGVLVAPALALGLLALLLVLAMMAAATLIDAALDGK